MFYLDPTLKFAFNLIFDFEKLGSKQIADFTFTLEQILMFLGDQTNLFVYTTVESACRFTVIPTLCPN
jgi:hypothetical protein